MTTTQKPKPLKIIPTDGEGECGACGRSGLVRLVELDNGQQVGTECMKKVCGWAPKREHVNLLAGLVIVAEYTDCGQHHVLYERPGTALTVLTTDALPVFIGGARAEWTRRGYAAA